MDDGGFFPQNGSSDGPLSVSAALARAKGALESFTVKLIGEVSELNNKPGYKAVYFTVKDDKASLPCMMWLNRYTASGVEMRVGMLVELTGRFTLYAPKGRMNFDVFDLSVAGEGDLRLKVANLAKKLQAEGLMDRARKRSVPVFPQVIGLVTSPRGAAVHDVLRTLRRRFPLARIVLAGVPVEGVNAACGLCDALEAVEKQGCEVVLLVRGGGSFEDLMPFNDERLARTIFNLGIPVVTGIGHEPDTSIADMVADLRASTPTAAAEAVSPSAEVIESLFSAKSARMQNALGRWFERTRSSLERIGERPLFKDSHTLFATEMQAIDSAEERLNRSIPLNLDRDGNSLVRYRERLLQEGGHLLDRFEKGMALRAARLHDLSPVSVLSRGYAIAKTEQGRIIKSIAEVDSGDEIKVDVSDGRFICEVKSIEETVLMDWETE